MEAKIPAILSLVKLAENKINKIFSKIPVLLQTTKIIFAAKQIVKHLEDKDDPHIQDITLLKKNLKSLRAFKIKASLILSLEIE